MSQNYKSYQFYEANDSDKDEDNTTTPNASKLVNKQNRKGVEKQTREKSLSSDSEPKEKGNLSDDSDDDEAGDISQNRKKLKTEQEPNFKADQTSLVASSDNQASLNLNTNQQQVGANKVMEIENQPSGLETSAPQDTNVLPVESNISPTELSDNNKPLAFIEAVKSKKAQVYVPNSFDPNTLMEIPKGISKGASETRKVNNEPASSKKKSGKYNRSPSSSPSPARENQVPKNTSSVENRQKSRLSNQLSKIKESLKNLPVENSDSDAEKNTENIPLADKPKFFIDAAPLGVLEQEGEEKKINFQGRALDSNERQYIVLGQERPFKTQEKNILEKLEKFLVPKEEEKKEEAAQEEEEKGEEVEDEFNFESRYFMYNPTKVCNRCKRPGHYEKWCPEDITVKCSFCVGPHKTDNCIQIICFHCYGIGHRARDCDAPGSLLCYRCGKKGHKISTCGMIVMKEATLDAEKDKQRADIKCIMCGRYGHSKCARQNATNRSNNKWFDGLYKEEAENRRESKKAELNMKVLARAKEVEAIEFEGAVSDDDGSYGGLEDFAKIEAPEYPASSQKEKRHKDKKHHHHRDHHRDHYRDNRDHRHHHRDHHSKSKKQKRYYN